MMRIALLIWMVLGTTLAGIAMMVIVTVPQLIDQGMLYIPILCGGAFMLAIPLAYLIAARIMAAEKH